MLYYLIGRQMKNNHSHFRKINMTNRLIVRSCLWLPLRQSSGDKATFCPPLLSSFSPTSTRRRTSPSPQEKGHAHQEHWLQLLQQSQLKHCNSQNGHTHQEHWLQLLQQSQYFVPPSPSESMQVSSILPLRSDYS